MCYNEKLFLLSQQSPIFKLTLNLTKSPLLLSNKTDREINENPITLVYLEDEITHRVHCFEHNIKLVAIPGDLRNVSEHTKGIHSSIRKIWYVIEIVVKGEYSDFTALNVNNVWNCAGYIPESKININNTKRVHF